MFKLPKLPTYRQRASERNLEAYIQAVDSVLLTSSFSKDERCQFVDLAGSLASSVLFNTNVMTYISYIKTTRKHLAEAARGNYTMTLKQILTEIPDDVILTRPTITIPEKPSFEWFQIMFLIYSVDRVILVRPSPDLSSITDIGVLDTQTVITPSLLSMALKSLSLNCNVFNNFYHTHLRKGPTLMSTSGPNGPYTTSAFLDAVAWIASPLFSTFKGFSVDSGQKWILESIRSLAPNVHSIPLPSKYILGKLSALEEWGGKLRIVAQPDYYLQQALTPLHNTIFSILKSLFSKWDGTFSHPKAAEKARLLTLSRDDLYAFDLSNATDRFPIDLQRRILAIIWHPHLANAWSKLMSNIPFMFEGKAYRYATGQPMGTRGSFGIFALAHHVLVHVAAILVSDFSPIYIIIGDDIVIAGRALALKYQELCNALGVPINQFKSFTPREGALPCIEICKRIFISGRELSIYNVKMLVKVILDSRLLPEFQEDLTRRIPDLTFDTFVLLISSLVRSQSRITRHLLLNMLPSSISGLSVPLSKVSSIYGYDISSVKSLYTYILFKAQLSRLNSLLTTALAIRQIFKERASHFSDIFCFQKDSPFSAMFNSVLGSKSYKVMSASLPFLADIFKFKHPVALACEFESLRLYNYLISLISDTAITVPVSLSKNLVDTFRHSVSVLWDDNRKLLRSDQRVYIRELLSILSRDSDEKANLSQIVMIPLLGKSFRIGWSPAGGVTLALHVSHGITLTSSFSKRITSVLAAVERISLSSNTSLKDAWAAYMSGRTDISRFLTTFQKE